MEQLKTYIQQARQSGHTDEQIHQTLMAAGWSEEQIGSAMIVPSSPTPQGFPQPYLPDNAQPSPQTVQQTPNQSFQSSGLPDRNYTTVTPNKRKFKLLIALVAITLLLLGAGGTYALLKETPGETNRDPSSSNSQSNNARSTDISTSDQVIEQLITAMRQQDKVTVDSLLSSDAEAFFKEFAGTESFYDSCQEVGDFCTSLFNVEFIDKATKSENDYVSKSGIKGEETKFSLHMTQDSGNGCSGESTTTLTISTVPQGDTWLIDNIDQGIEGSANLCPVSN